jgi:Domain of unknown function (DUF6602)
MNKLYRSLMASSIQKTLDDMRATASYRNQLLKGRAREIFIANILRPYLNPTMGICTGMVTDSDGNHSAQIDIIIFDRNVVPPFLLTEGEGIVPIESVLATVEVKSKLTSSEVQSAVENARSVKLLKPFFAEMKPSALTKKSPLCCLFAYSSDLHRKSEKSRLQSVVDAMNRHMPEVLVPISSICIAKKYYALCSNPVKKTTFEERHESANTNVVLHFMVDIIDSCNILALQRERIFIRKYVLGLGGQR